MMRLLDPVRRMQDITQMLSLYIVTLMDQKEAYYRCGNLNEIRQFKLVDGIVLEACRVPSDDLGRCESCLSSFAITSKETANG